MADSKPKYWYIANGVPVPAKPQTHKQAVAYLAKCQAAKNQDEIQKLAEA